MVFYEVYIRVFYCERPALWHNSAAMALRLVLPLLLCGWIVFQNRFPHPVEPGVKVVRLAKARLSKQDRKAVADLVLGRYPSNCVRPGYSMEGEIDLIGVAWASLAAGERELFVQASDQCNCGATGNCGFWILRKTTNGFAVLLETNMVQRFSVEKTSSNGYKDVVTASHDSAAMSGVTLYKFDGKQYQKNACGEIEYELQEDGHFAKTPKITAAECSKD